MRLKLILTWIFLIQILLISAQVDIKKRSYEPFAISTENADLEIDGKLTDSLWKKVKWTGDFIQREPYENQTPSERTSFALIFDDQNLYIGVKCYHDADQLIAKRMSRRDIIDGDWVEIQIDSYNDKQSCFVFTVSAAGVKSDRTISLDGEVEDLNWNPVWQSKTDMTANLWTVEMSIPLSQLRFGNQSHQTWGLQFLRRIFYREEIDVWQRISLDASGWISNFGQLKNITNIRTQHQLELQPYMVTSLNTFQRDPSNPYLEKYRKNIKVGVDGKIGLSSDFIIDFTVNPDFGQVEADPSDIALDGFQLFFDEQRPFFIENKQVFDYAFSSSAVGNTFENDNLFYSRRLGRPPHRNYVPSDLEYVRAPDNTSILGAVKLSGKTSKGLSIGVLESVTSKEYALISREGDEYKEIIEPLTNYLVARVKQDLNDRNSYIGAIYTQTNRSLDTPLDFLHRSARSAGIDFLHRWKARSWYVGGNIISSHVRGSSQALEATQRSISHLFQREGSAGVLDTSRMSLTGTGGNLKVGKAGGGHMKFEGGLTWRSPSLELNDIGFLRQADDLRHYFALQYGSLRPTSILRNMQISYKHWFSWDFTGHLNRMHLQLELSGTFLNNWHVDLGGYSKPVLFNNFFLQGGPSVRIHPEHGCWLAISTDTRKRLSFNHDFTLGLAGEGGHWIYAQWGLRYQPSNRFSISLDNYWSKIMNYPQYITTVREDQIPIYVAAGINQETFRIVGRINYSINPNLSFQYFIQPYATRGVYDSYRQVPNPGSKPFTDQFRYFSKDEVAELDDNQISLSRTGEGKPDLVINNPDFSLNELRANLVIRWEYQPGSELFLVWNKSFSMTGIPGQRILSDYLNSVRGELQNNVFLLKYTYRFIR